MIKELKDKELKKKLLLFKGETEEIDNEDYFYKNYIGKGFMSIEDATSIIQSKFQNEKDGILDDILKNIVSEFEDTIFLDIIAVYDKNGIFDQEDKDVKESRKRCDKLRKKNPNAKYIVHLCCLDMAEYGGHWGGFVYDIENDTNYSYDSMQTRKITGEDFSFYSKFFQAYGCFVFKTKKCLTLKHQGRQHNSRQPAGGFLGATRYSHELDENLSFVTSKSKTSIRKEADKYYTVDQFIVTQDFNQQHHMCWVEATIMVTETLLSFHGLLDNELSKKRMNMMFPLFVVKRFVWKLSQKMKVKYDKNKEMNNKIIDYLKKYFTKVWSSSDIIYINIGKYQKEDRYSEYWHKKVSMRNKKLSELSKEEKPKFSPIEIINPKNYDEEAAQDMSMIDILKYAYSLDDINIEKIKPNLPSIDMTIPSTPKPKTPKKKLTNKEKTAKYYKELKKEFITNIPIDLLNEQKYINIEHQRLDKLHNLFNITVCANKDKDQKKWSAWELDAIYEIIKEDFNIKYKKTDIKEKKCDALRKFFDETLNYLQKMVNKKETDN